MNKMKKFLRNVLRFGLRQAEKLKDPFAAAMLIVGIGLEILLIGSEENIRRSPGHEAGVLAIRMGHHWSVAVSWLVFLLIGIGLIVAVYALWWWAVSGLIVLVVVIELIFGNHLPSPQNSWVAGGAYVIALLGSFMAMIRHSERVQEFLASLEN